MSIFKEGDIVIRIKGEDTVKGMKKGEIHVVNKIFRPYKMTLVHKNGLWDMRNFSLIQEPNYEIY